MQELRRDVLHTFRQFRRQPGFWSAVVLMLVLGVSMSTSVFAIVNGVILRPLPYPDSERLVSLYGVGVLASYVPARRVMSISPALALRSD